MKKNINFETNRHFFKNGRNLNISRLSANCSRCKKKSYVDELSALPEVEAYVRQYASAMLHKEHAPVPVDEDMLMKRYGYGFKSVFCKDCLQKLIKNTK